MIGFVDESMREGQGGLYVVAAVVFATDLEDARRATRSVLLPRQVRFHWHQESEPQRLKMLEHLAGVATSAMAYACRPISLRQQERARALCLNRLLWDVRDIGVTELVFESRQQRNNQKDRRTIVHAVKSGIASPTLRYRFERPKEEPLLWLPDAVAGAVATDLAAGGSYLETLDGWVAVTELGP
jgi:hypothetical protein